MYVERNAFMTRAVVPFNRTNLNWFGVSNLRSLLAVIHYWKCNYFTKTRYIIIIVFCYKALDPTVGLEKRAWLIL